MTLRISVGNNVVYLNSVGAFAEQASVAVSIERIPPRAFPFMRIGRGLAASPKHRFLTTMTERLPFSTTPVATCNRFAAGKSLEFRPTNLTLPIREAASSPAAAQIASARTIISGKSATRNIKRGATRQAVLFNSILGSICGQAFSALSPCGHSQNVAQNSSFFNEPEYFEIAEKRIFNHFPEAKKEVQT